jgi:DNA-binding response OmpR family regulator
MRVLLIEDDGTTAQSIKLMLRSESFNVYTTDLGASARRLLASRSHRTGDHPPM